MTEDKKYTEDEIVIIDEKAGTIVLKEAGAIPYNDVIKPYLGKFSTGDKVKIGIYGDPEQIMYISGIKVVKKATPEDLEQVFNTLKKIKCPIEKKGRFNYVSWTDAWEEVMKIYPDSTFKVYENTNGFPAFIHETAGAFVKVGVTIKGIEHIEHYPVTDNFNKAIKGSLLDVFAINTAIKRAMVKAMAYFGLGLYVYQGEDLPEE